MRGRLAIVLCVALGLLAAPVASGSVLAMSTKVRVSPGTGGIHTNFTLRFAIPDAIGPLGGLGRSDLLVVSGPRRTGCVSAAAVSLRSAAADSRFTIRLNPAHFDGHWCTGTFTGSLIERDAPVCGPIPVELAPAIMCPEFVIAPVVLARFRFKVTAAARSSTSRA